MAYTTKEILALAAPLWGLGMEDLQGVTIVGVTKDERVVYVDTSVFRMAPPGPHVPTEAMTREEAITTADHLIWLAHAILQGGQTDG